MAKQKAPKHIPMRTCTVCRSKLPKRALSRVVQTPTGVQVDATGKVNGRGAYLCDNRSCWERAVKTNILEMALKTALSDADRQHLSQAMP